MIDSQILLVEDNPDDGIPVLRVLRSVKNKRVKVYGDNNESADYEICHNTCADQDIGRQIDLILLCLSLPGFYGVGIARRLQNNQQIRYHAIIIPVSSNCQSDVGAVSSG